MSEKIITTTGVFKIFDNISTLIWIGILAIIWIIFLFIHLNITQDKKALSECGYTKDEIVKIMQMEKNKKQDIIDVCLIDW